MGVRASLLGPAMWQRTPKLMDGPYIPFDILSAGSSKWRRGVAGLPAHHLVGSQCGVNTQGLRYRDESATSCLTEALSSRAAIIGTGWRGRRRPSRSSTATYIAIRKALTDCDHCRAGNCGMAAVFLANRYRFIAALEDRASVRHEVALSSL